LDICPAQTNGVVLPSTCGRLTLAPLERALLYSCDLGTDDELFVSFTDYFQLRES